MLVQIEDFKFYTELDKNAFVVYEEYIDIQRYATQFDFEVFIKQKKCGNIKLFYDIAMKQLRLDKLNKICGVEIEKN